MNASGPGLLTAVVRFAVLFRGIVIALALMLAGYGAYVLGNARYDVFPEFAPPQVAIQTEAPGLAPEQVELLVTQHIESAVSGAPAVDSLRSASIQGLSVVTVVFDPGTDVYRDRQLVAERLAAAASQIPRGVGAPAMTPLTSSTSTVLVAGLTSETRSLMDLRTLADWTIRPRLLAVPGVAKLSVFGGEVRQVQVQVHPDRLVGLDLGWIDVVSSAQRTVGLRGAGFLETENQRLVLRTTGQPVAPRDLAHTVLRHSGGSVVTLGGVADVVDGPEPSIGAAAINGRPGVLLVVSQQYGANTLDVTTGAETALREIRPTLEAAGVTLHPDLFRPARFIETATRSVRAALLLGGALVVLVLFAFLFDWRTAAISCTAIPLSLLAAVVALDRLGLSLNTMTLGGLAIAIGEVVDDAVIDVENVVRRLREARRLGSQEPAWRIVLSASIEVRGAVVYATLAVILVFVPVLTLPGVAGRLFAPLGLAYILAVLASLAVALTVTPALCMVLLASRRLSREDPPILRWTKARYEALIRTVEQHPRPVLAAIGALGACALLALPFFGAAFLPELKEGHFIVHASELPGASLAESLRVGGRVSEALLRLPFVRSVAQQAGRAEQSEDVWGPHYSEIHVDLRPLSGKQSEAAVAEVRKTLSSFVGLSSASKTFLTERVEETLTGYTAAVVVNVFGADLEELDRAAREVARVLGEIPGAAEVQVQSPPGLPSVDVRLRSEDLLRWGFEPTDVLDTVRSAYQGEVLGQVYDGNRVFDVAVVLSPDQRRSAARLRDLPLRSESGTFVRLGQLADIADSAGRYQVLHQGARRVQTVTANVAGRDVASFVEEAKRRVDSQVKLPANSYVEFAGTAEAQIRSRRDLLLHSGLAAVGIMLLLSIVTRKPRNLLLLAANVPFALVGGVVAVFATGGVLSLGSMVGFVTLSGITLRNSIMMVSHYEHLVSVEGQTWGLETAIRGATDRLAPILMTSLVTALGLLPLAIGMREPGREIEGPMAVVILGGLFTSMALNLLALPALAYRYGRFIPETEV